MFELATIYPLTKPNKNVFKKLSYLYDILEFVIN